MYIYIYTYIYTYLYIYIYIYISYHILFRQLLAAPLRNVSGAHRVTTWGSAQKMPRSVLRPISVLRFCISEGLTQS